jgi:hypothetical protein
MTPKRVAVENRPTSITIRAPVMGMEEGGSRRRVEKEKIQFRGVHVGFGTLKCPFCAFVNCSKGGMRFMLLWLLLLEVGTSNLDASQTL